MDFSRVGIVCGILVMFAASSAVAEETSVLHPVKTPPHVANAKIKAEAKIKHTDPADIENIKFSDPSAPLGGAAKSPKPAVPPTGTAVAPVPVGGPSLDLKWHAENHVNNPYWQPWVPNGQGQSVEAGVKFGF